MRKKLTFSELKNQINLVHKNKYFLPDQHYNGLRQKIRIICPIHGEYKAFADNLRRGFGCKACSDSLNGLKKRKTIDELRTMVLNKNDNLSIQEQFIGNCKDALFINCNKHGLFSTKIESITTSIKICKKCASENNNLNSWRFSEWERKGELSKKFDGYKLYIVKLYDDFETFYKIGKTFNPIKTRLYSIKNESNYNYEILDIKTSTANEISRLEIHLHSQNKSNKYLPLKKFAGMTECYSNINYNN